MPSLSQTMAASPREFVAEKHNAKVIPSLIMIDNVLGAQDAILVVQDVFTPAVSNGVAIPVETTVDRLSINVSQLACVSIQDELKDIEILGLLQLTIDTVDPACIVSVAWGFK